MSFGAFDSSAILSAQDIRMFHQNALAQTTYSVISHDMQQCIPPSLCMSYQ